MKKNILFLTNDFPPAEGGMETCAFELSSEFKKKFNQLIIIGSTAEHITLKKENHIIRIKLSRNYLLKFLKLFFFLFFKILFFRPDFIYLNTWSPFGLPVFLITKIFRIPYFITCHGLDIVEPLKSKFHKNIMSVVLNGASKLFCVSSYTKSLVELHGKIKFSEKIKIINNGINLSKFYPEDTKTAKRKNGVENKFVLLTVSRLTPRKGHLRIIEILPDLIKTIPEIIYIIVGRGAFEKEITEKIQELKLENYVKLTGFVEDSKLIDYYNACDIFVMLSSEIIETGDVEGFGVSYLEANACGKSVIAAPIAGALDAVKNGINGFMADTDERLKKIILDLYLNCDKMELIGKTARTFLETNFDWKIIAEKYYGEISSAAELV